MDKIWNHSRLWGFAMSTPIVDQEARQMARDAANQINTHELVCAERWRSTMQTMKEIKAILAWGGGTLIVVLLAAVGLG